MKAVLQLLLLMFATIYVNAQDLNGSEEDRNSIEKATRAIREAFAKGDAALATRLHHPNIVKYFGGDNVVTGRVALEKGLTSWFEGSTVQFVENTVESTMFNNGTAVQTCIFSIKNIPKSGGEAIISRGRSLVVYVRDDSSPTGWLSAREMVQEAPAERH